MKKQNYKESREILELIKKSKKIVLNCHRGPDPDSVGSALALSGVLEKMNKHTDIICSSDYLYDEVSFLRGYDKIAKNIDFPSFNFGKYDLFVALDSSSWDMVSGEKEMGIPDIPIIVIDHHHTNMFFGKHNLVDSNSSSVGELLYYIFEDWGVNIDRNVATSLLSAIIGDTGLLKYPNVTPKTIDAFNNLMKRGADKELIINNIYRSVDYNLLKFCSVALGNMKLDRKHRFVYSFVSYEELCKFGKPENAKNYACDIFAQNTKGTDFGLMGLEREKNLLSLSFRSRMGVDVSKIAIELGGGGHKQASGGSVEMPYNEAVEKVLKICRKYARKHINEHKGLEDNK